MFIAELADHFNILDSQLFKLFLPKRKEGCAIILFATATGESRFRGFQDLIAILLEEMLQELLRRVFSEVCAQWRQFLHPLVQEKAQLFSRTWH